MPEYSTEQLIEEIEKRPVIWDSSCEDYNNRNIRNNQWKEVVDALLKNSEGEADAQTKKELENALQRKWKGIRGCYTRELNRQALLAEGKCNANVRFLRKSKYIYFDKLQFLRNTIKLKPKEEADDRRSSTSSDSQDYEETEFDPRVKRIKGEMLDFEVAVDPLPYNEMSNNLDTSNKLIDERKLEKPFEDDEDKMFLMSLLSTLKKVPENKRLATRIKIMQVLDEATHSH